MYIYVYILYIYNYMIYIYIYIYIYICIILTIIRIISGNFSLQKVTRKRHVSVLPFARLWVEASLPR